MQRNLLAAQFDAATQLKDAGQVTASGAATVNGSPQVVSVGTGFIRMTLIVDVDNMDLTTGDEFYELRLQGSTTPDFSADIVNLAGVSVGDSSTRGESVDATIGRYARTVMNSKDGVKAYPYLRLFHQLSGTTPIVTYRAFLTKDTLAG